MILNMFNDFTPARYTYNISLTPSPLGVNDFGTNMSTMAESKTFTLTVSTVIHPSGLVMDIKYFWLL